MLLNHLPEPLVDDCTTGGSLYFTARADVTKCYFWKSNSHLRIFVSHPLSDL